MYFEQYDKNLLCFKYIYIYILYYHSIYILFDHSIEIWKYHNIIMSLYCIDYHI